MKTFLDEISKKIISLNYQFEDIKIVVPNKRAISFFKKSLSNNLSKPQFSPEIISIEKFMEEMSGLKKIQRIDLLFYLYEIYKTDNIGDFNEFLRWANTALDDFDEIDFHLLNADDFFELGGLGGATLQEGNVMVSCLIAVNASGDIDFGEYPNMIRDGKFSIPKVNPFENTTIGVVATNAKLTKSECFLVSQSAHDGYARALFPAHTSADGDAVVVAATGQVPAEMSTIRSLTTLTVETAIRSITNE